MSAAGDKVLVVSIAFRHRRDAIAKVCHSLEGLRLAVIAANITSASGTVTHTALVQVTVTIKNLYELSLSVKRILFLTLTHGLISTQRFFMYKFIYIIHRIEQELRRKHIFTRLYRIRASVVFL